MRPARALVVGAVLLLGGAALWRVARRADDSARVPESGAARAEAPPTPAPSPSVAPAPRTAAAAFVDESACAACHTAQAEAWHGSDHDLAMQPAEEGTVLGDFADARYTDPHLPALQRPEQVAETLFTRAAHGFAVETEGPQGERARFDVPYVFGVDPLQQLLLPLERGRLQALTIAWDTKAERWYSLYPDEHIGARDPLHWTRPAYNWNFSCAECHATDLARNYDAERDAYDTRWHRLDVGCQACHGPAARHLEWARSGAQGAAAPGGLGFDAPLAVPDSAIEVEACARCHARRAPLGDGFDHRNRLLDDYLPALLTEGLYHADGQILDEVYEYGSFLQSKMHAKGLRCSDCHDPHSLRPKQPGNVLCTGCHSPTPAARAHVDLTTLVRKPYDTPEHHHHAPGTPGSQCVDCHMPQRTYMVVDPRRDHGFRVPRPDLAGATGAPDACTQCHAERDPAWAVAAIAEWTGPKERPPHFGTALGAGRAGASGAADALLALAGSREPPIVRATALAELARYPSRAALDAFTAARADPDGLVRLAAARGFELLPPAERAGALGPLLSDPLRGVRAEAARLIVGVPAEALGPLAGAAHAALADYEAIQRALLERPEARLNLAQVLVGRGEHAAAEAELRAALRLDRLYVPSYANLADLVRSTKGEAEAEAVLREGLARVTDAPALLHALGLALVRQERSEEGLVALGRAAELGPEDPRFGYVHAVALHDLGQPEEARAALARVLARHAGDRDARFALAQYLGEAGDAAGAERCLAELAAINPHDPGLGNAVEPPHPNR